MKYTILLSLFFIILRLHAQDYHYWSEHFGARASMLGGAATSGLGDNATTYYNPAAMAFVEDPSLSVSVNAYRVTSTKLENALGKGLDLKGMQLSTMPNLIAGVLTFEKAKRFRLGYSVITRRNHTSKYDYLHQGYYDISNFTAGKELYVASYNIHHQLNEYWAGFGVSYQLSKGFAIGFAHYGIYRDVKYNNSHEMTVLPQDGSLGYVPSVSANVTFNYWNVKGIFKPSISLSVENFKFGMTLTTSSFNMLGRANVYRDYSIINMNELIGTDVSVIDRAANVKAVHKEWGSLAIGVSWRLGKKAWLHWTNESFFGGKYYLIFNPDQAPNVYPSYIAEEDLYTYFGSQNFLALGEESVARTNIGLGFESRIAKRWEMYLGARTDFMYNEQPYYLFSRIGIDASKWNLYHFSFGLVNLTKKNKRYTAGIEYSLTPRQEFYHIIDFTNPSLANGLVGQGDRGAYASVHSFKLLLEITIGSLQNGEKNE